MTVHSLYTISPDRPFVDVLAEGLMNRAGGDPMALARMRVLLPSRRAISSLREAFLRLSGGRPLLLPHMQPVGDVDEEEMLLSGFFASEGHGEAIEAEVPPVMPASRRLLLLAQLIHRYHQLEYGPSARMDQAVHLARELAALLDEAEREECDIASLAHIVPADLATHWQLTLDFLGIIIHEWPQILEREGRVNPIARRNLLLRQLAAQWQAQPPRYPVIAAGTTGSAPATAHLLEVISKLPQGMVVLPGWDREMPEAVWNELDETHPHYGMKQLLKRMGLSREAVQEFDGDAAPSPRVALLQAALQPAITTSGWQAVQMDWKAALKGCSRIDCATVQEEATAIALLLRDTLELPGKTAALITPNRDLARRVAAALRRFHVAIDDSAGIPLHDTPAGIFLRLLTDVAINLAAPVSLLSLLKHPLALAGLPAGTCRHLARALERATLRGVRLAEGFDAIKQEIRAGNQKDVLLNFAERLEKMIIPYMQKIQEKQVALSELIQTHIAVAEALSTSADGTVTLWQGEEGEQLSAFFHEVLASAEGFAPMDAAAYAGTFNALLAGRIWRPRYGMHPRIRILSPIEARLQLFDRVILGGLNEGVWPMDVGQDPWMSRPMRAAFGLSSPERQTGLSAHDFYSLSSAPEVIFTRSAKEGNSPSVPSRWLLRMEALLGVLGGGEAQTAWMQEGAQWCRWAAHLDAVANAAPCDPPAPKPPLHARPRELYVTHIETLLRNPYGIYASKILRLRKLDPLDQEPGAAEFGNLVHDAIERYIKSGKYDFENLLQYGKEVFGRLMDRPGVEAFWWPRFQRIAAWFVEEEKRRNAEVATIAAEQEGRMAWPAPAGEFVLKARIDRMEVVKDGSLRIIDYKTGAVPPISDVERGIAAQLLLEAVIAKVGYIGGVARDGVSIADLEYWHLRGGREAGVVTSIAAKASKSSGLEAWIAAADEGVRAIIAQYDDLETPYRHSPNAADAPRFDDFAHLARAAEWGAGT